VEEIEVQFQRDRRRLGFTLVELLVVIAIIGVLVALLLPAVQAAREAARRMACGNNLKQLGLALHNYHDSYSMFPPGGITPGNCCGTPSAGTWTLFILPFLEFENLHNRYNFNLWNDASPGRTGRTGGPNAYVPMQYLDVHICPSDIDTDHLDRPNSGPGRNMLYAPGSYRAVSGASTGGGWLDANTGRGFVRQNKGVLHHVGATQYPHLDRFGSRSEFMPEGFNSIVDGSSNTLMIGEMHTLTHNRRRTFWAYTYTSYNQSTVTVGETRTLLGDYDLCVRIGGRGGSNACKRGWGSNHPGVLQFCLADASVRGISQTVDMGIGLNNNSVRAMGVLPSLASIAGNEPVAVPK
jgi:prepilin-type N-terminal cleavage/methylation domain-containing protein